MSGPTITEPDGEGGFHVTWPDGSRDHIMPEDRAIRIRRTANGIREAMNHAPWLDYETIAKSVVEYEEKQERYNYPK